MQGDVRVPDDLAHRLPFACESRGDSIRQARIARDAVIDRYQAMAPALNAIFRNIQIEPPDIGAMTARLENDRPIDDDGVFHAVMGVTADDHVNSGHVLGQLHILRKTEVGQDHNQIGILPQPFNMSGQFGIARDKAKPLAERWRHRLVHNRAGEADNAYPHPVAFDDGRGRHKQFATVFAEDICSEHRVGQLARYLSHTFRAVGKLPV